MNELITIEPSNALQVFTADRAIDPLLAKIAAEARSLVSDVNTAKGRKEIASTAYKVAQSKTYIDNAGKTLVAEMKELPKKVDAARKQARDFLDALRDEIRAPLDAWEAEQARIEAEKKAAEEAAALAKQVEHDHEVGLLLNADHDRQAEAVRISAEQARIDREAGIAEEAAARAKAEAESRARQEREAAERKQIEAEIAAKTAETQRVAAETQRIAAEERADRAEREAAEKAKRAAAEAIEAERARQARKDEAERVETERRMADREHKAEINRAALAALEIEVGLTEDEAKAVIKSIASGLIPNVSIAY